MNNPMPDQPNSQRRWLHFTLPIPRPVVDNDNTLHPEEI